ncbi:hypothetical protein HER10_EVM0006706 [Colletotrichum scovillei]|uniref:uncharacterized protein n=1 Tax=Colletotrichum scovillei TaxID=1209932 RepID=UPI0015C2EC18|nr:uncharacterized protein HER10_EVM0006706 [Colletotrichum scovillei]KAF4775119.1 hypothetical protein HER10_EVM0006706 [Colletotrichum scovillei]
MKNLLRYDVALWQIHETEDDCDLIIRTNNGRAFYCTISPSQFHRSPRITEQYFKCLELLRSGEDEQDDFYVEDACDWLSRMFEPLITQLAPPSSVLPNGSLPTLSQYLFPPHIVCGLDATDDVPHPYQAENQNHGWCSPVVVADDELLGNLDQWARSYDPSDIEILYDRPEDVLIRRPTKVLVDAENGDKIMCYFKHFGLSFGQAHARSELARLNEIATAQIPSAPDAWICRLHGIVRDGNNLMGMLFNWIEKKGVLSRARANQSTSEIRKRWRTQISTSLKQLHCKGIVWGDAKAENVLIDQDDNAWIIDFGGSYTPGWVDQEKAGTMAGDAQGLTKILDFLR